MGIFISFVVIHYAFSNSQISFSCICFLTSNPTGTTRRIDIDSMSILLRYIKKKMSTNFHVVSTYFFGLISMNENSHRFVVLFGRNFDGRKIHVVSIYFLRHHCDRRIIDVILMYFFQSNLCTILMLL